MSAEPDKKWGAAIISQVRLVHLREWLDCSKRQNLQGPSALKPALTALRVVPSKIRTRVTKIMNELRRPAFSKEISEWPVLTQSPWSTSTYFQRTKSEILTWSRTMTTESPCFRENLEALARTSLHACKFLDFGCGTGIYLSILRKYGPTNDWSYTGADVNARVVEFLRELYPDAKFEVLNGNRLQFETGQFDVVMASGVLQYIDRYYEILRELCRVVSRYLLVSRLPVFNDGPTRIFLQHHTHRGGTESFPLHVFNRQEIESQFRALGLGIDYNHHGRPFYRAVGIPEIICNSMYLLQKK